MEKTSTAINVLARCYPMARSPEECASGLPTHQKRREEIKAKTPPSQGVTGLGVLTLRPLQALAAQNLRRILIREIGRRMRSSPAGSGETEIGMARMEKQEFYSKLLCVARKQENNPGWVSHKYRRYLVVWPRGIENILERAVSQEVFGFLKHLQIRHAKAKTKEGAHASD